MNTIIRIQVTSTKGTVFTKEKIEDAFSCFDHVVDHFSRFNKKSELSLLNKGELVGESLSQEMYELIKLALDTAYLTKGIYDPTIIDLLEAYGYDSANSFKGLKNPKLSAEIKKLMANRPSFKEIELDDKHRTVKLVKGQRLDLGSVAKGYAVDLAIESLNKYGFDGILVNAGGDIRALGVNPAHLPWQVALFKAALPNSSYEDKAPSWGNIELLNESISGSGGWARRVGIFHHLIDTSSGFPQNDISQTFVIAPTATKSDLWSTVLFLMGKDALPLLQKQGYKGMVVDYQGAIYKSEQFIYH
jgi:thiamine biosynthesis lipoprotein